MPEYLLLFKDRPIDGYSNELSRMTLAANGHLELGIGLEIARCQLL